MKIHFCYFRMKANRTVLIKNIFGKSEKGDELQIWMKVLKINNVNSGMKEC